MIGQPQAAKPLMPLASGTIGMGMPDGVGSEVIGNRNKYQSVL